MPILPLDHPEPFIATLGVMLYPGIGEDERLKARAFASHWLATPIRRFHEAGHKMPHEALLQIATDGDCELDDVDDRWRGGTATGELFKVLFALFLADRTLTSWNNAVKIAEHTATSAKASGSRSAQWAVRSRFLSVAHLWGAWSIREGKFEPRPDIGYDGYSDFQFFLKESEMLRKWGQEWRPPRKDSKPLLPPEVWHVPEDWEPPIRQPEWPETGTLPHLTLAEDLLAMLKPAGRPRKRV